MADFLVLNRSEVQQCLDVRTSNDLVERGFRSLGKGLAGNLPTTTLLVTDPAGRCNIKPGYLLEERTMGIKVIRTFPGNQAQGLAPSQSQILVVDLNTGELRAIMDGGYITRCRTGSAGAVGARLMARPDARNVAVIGAGIQGESLLEALAADRTLGQVRVWSRTADRREQYARKMGERLGLDIHPCATVEETVRGAEIILTATWSYEVLIQRDWVQPGAYIGAIGADGPGMQELDPDLLRAAKVVVDDVEQCSRIGEINVPLSRGEYRLEQLHGTLAEVCAGLKPGRSSADEITILDSTGVGLQDTVAADWVYRRALQLGLGKSVNV
jgi:alanine dehydrogenase